jgi:hypothetical protein
MVKRNERNEQQLQKQVADKTSTVITVTALVSLVVCAFIYAVYGKVPDIVFWILGAAIVPDAIKYLRGDKR